MNESEIERAIENRVMTARTKDYKIWTVGITDDPTRRKGEHETTGENIEYWLDWKADTETIARTVESYFLAKGMKGGAGGGERPTYVYIF
jgi:hypothetical protein